MSDGADLRIESPMLRELYAYWGSCRRGRAFPRRADFEPTDIPALLPHLYMVDVEHGADPRFRVRLSGTFLDSVFQQSGTNRYLNDYAVNRSHPRWLDSYRRVIAERRPAVSRQRFTNDQNRAYDYERLILPLAVADDARVDMIVGGIDFDRPLPTPSVVRPPKTG